MSSEFERLRESCLKKGELFEDPDFPAVQTSIFYHQKPPFSFVWKRPKVAFAFIYYVSVFEFLCCTFDLILDNLRAL